MISFFAPSRVSPSPTPWWMPAETPLTHHTVISLMVCPTFPSFIFDIASVTCSPVFIIPSHVCMLDAMTLSDIRCCLSYLYRIAKHHLMYGNRNCVITKSCTMKLATACWSTEGFAFTPDASIWEFEAAAMTALFVIGAICWTSGGMDDQIPSLSSADRSVGNPRSMYVTP